MAIEGYSSSQAHSAMTARRMQYEPIQKGYGQSAYPSRIPMPQSMYQSEEPLETDFEEDLSDYEEFSGRRSEDSVRISISSSVRYER